MHTTAKPALVRSVTLPAENLRDGAAAGLGSGEIMKLKAIVHEAEEGGYWAEVPAVPGCATQGDTYEELLRYLQEAIE